MSEKPLRVITIDNEKVLAVCCQEKCAEVLELYDNHEALKAHHMEIALCMKCEKGRE